MEQPDPWHGLLAKICKATAAREPSPSIRVKCANQMSFLLLLQLHAGTVVLLATATCRRSS